MALKKIERLRIYKVDIIRNFTKKEKYLSVVVLGIITLLYFVIASRLIDIKNTISETNFFLDQLLRLVFDSQYVAMIGAGLMAFLLNCVITSCILKRVGDFFEKFASPIYMSILFLACNPWYVVSYGTNIHGLAFLVAISLSLYFLVTIITTGKSKKKIIGFLFALLLTLIVAYYLGYASINLLMYIGVNLIGGLLASYVWHMAKPLRKVWRVLTLVALICTLWMVHNSIGF